MLMTQIPDAGFRPFADMPLLKSGLASILRFRVWKGWAVTGNRCRISSDFHHLNDAQRGFPSFEMKLELIIIFVFVEHLIRSGQLEAE